MKIILIDDDEFSLRTITRQLSEIGLEDVACFARAADALHILETVEKHHQVVVICDLQMPDMDGVELVRQLGIVRFSGSIIIVSGENKVIVDAARTLALEHGLHVAAALTKPVATAQIADALKKSTKNPDTASIQAPKAAICTVNDVRNAICDRQFQNFYQPKIHTQSGRTYGVEALVRWRRRNGLFTYPDEFIPIAEANNLIGDITEQVMENAFRDAAHLRQRGWSLSVSVNVSMQDLVSLRFPDQIAGLAQRHGVPLTSVTLEVTESQIMTDVKSTLDILARLRLKKLSLSIDDFGTGYSTLTQLRDCPFTELKIDRSFIHSETNAAASRSIAECSLEMAKRLGMMTVAEGVESQRDLMWLRNLGTCDFVQGYYFSRPIALNELKTWLDDHHSRSGEIPATPYKREGKEIPL